MCLFLFSGLSMRFKGRKNSGHILIGTLRDSTKKIRISMTNVSTLTLWIDTFPKNCHGLMQFFFILDVSFCKILFKSPWKGSKLYYFWKNTSNEHCHEVSSRKKYYFYPISRCKANWSCKPAILPAPCLNLKKSNQNKELFTQTLVPFPVN